MTGYTDNVDRWQIIEFTPPGFVWLQVGSAKASTGGPDAAADDILLDRHTLHVMMPETENSTLYFWAMANGADALTTKQEDQIYAASMQAFNEDIVIIEGQQDRWNPAQSSIDVSADAGVLDVRPPDDAADRRGSRRCAGNKPARGIEPGRAIFSRSAYRF